MPTAEHQRLREAAERRVHWRRWGTYLPERQWGTVREDYSSSGDVWSYFTHEQAIARAYRWGEDGLLGWTDRQCRLCLAPAFWNERDSILKERLFGLTGPEGNHGEDVKEEFFYIDATPTASYAKALYRYPQERFPYSDLREANARRGLHEPEFELRDTGIFEENAFFDITIEYAKAGPQDILARIRAVNRGPRPAPLHVLPTLWFRNTWAWGPTDETPEEIPQIHYDGRRGCFIANHETLGAMRFEWAQAGDIVARSPLFTNNETNLEALFGVENKTSWTKDAFHRAIVGGDLDAVNPALRGTKAAIHLYGVLAPGQTVEVRLRLCEAAAAKLEPASAEFDAVFARREAEADEFYGNVLHGLEGQPFLIARQAHAGLCWTRQFYYYIVPAWLVGDSAQPTPPPERARLRNHDWPHLYARDVLSMPDKWEYPWFAAWDLGFHMLPMAKTDPEFAKAQLQVLLREWYMHPNGQLPAYEFNFSDVNPPVHAWAAWRVYKMTGPPGDRDTAFLESIYQKLLLNFTWWVNRKDSAGRHLFSGGFLGLDNIGVFDRSRPLPHGGELQQADGTSWMAFYALTMLAISLELAEQVNPVYEDMASKFFEHFIQIADAMNRFGGSGLWDETDGFYYDAISINGESSALKVRSLVGLLPLIAVEVLVEEKIKPLKGFYSRFQWFVRHRRDLARQITMCDSGACPKTQQTFKLLAIPSRERLERIFRRLLDETEFLSPFGIRSLSKAHAAQPFKIHLHGEEMEVRYQPGESDTRLFGGNSNWRGPVWFPVNYLIYEALEKYYFFYGDALQVEVPTGSGRFMNLREAKLEIGRRLASLFLPDLEGRRPFQGTDTRFQDDAHWRGLTVFHEYFHGETGAGLGASHQTGWTALIANLLQDLGTNL